MACRIIRAPDGSGMIACGVRGRVQRCQIAACGREAVALCDHPVGGLRTCSARLCAHHRVSVGLGDDRCPEHALELVFDLERIGPR